MCARTHAGPRDVAQTHRPSVSTFWVLALRRCTPHSPRLRSQLTSEPSTALQCKPSAGPSSPQILYPLTWVLLWHLWWAAGRGRLRHLVLFRARRLQKPHRRAGRWEERTGKDGGETWFLANSCYSPGLPCGKQRQLQAIPRSICHAISKITHQFKLNYIYLYLIIFQLGSC